MKHIIIQDNTFDFAIGIIRLYQFLTDSKKEYVLAKQVLRSGTSIGANVEEAAGGVSKADFKNKLSISYKEARETLYWLRLLHATDYLTKRCSTLFSMIVMKLQGFCIPSYINPNTNY